MKTFFTPLFILFFFLNTYAQNINYSYGKVGLEDINYELSAELGEADAVYLYNSAKIYGNVLIYHYRIKILTEKGLDLANRKIEYNWGNEEEVVFIMAESHTLEDGEIKVNEINQKEVYIEDYGENYRRKSFTIPNVKIGSVIEIRYKLERNLNFYLPSFYFQKNYPVIKAKLLCQDPKYVTYAAILTGQLANNITKKEGYFNDSDSPEPELMSYIYTAENIPAFKEEDLVYSYKNYITKMDFQAYSTTRDGILYKDWAAVAKELNNKLYKIISGQKSEALFNDYQYILNKPLSDLEKIKMISEALQKEYYINDYLGMKFNTTAVKKTYTEKKGTPANINILAGVLFLYGQIPVEPIFVSTLDNGYIDMQYPYLGSFNHFVWKYTSPDKKEFIIDIRNQFAPIEMIHKDLIGSVGLDFYEGKTQWYNFTKGIRTNKKDISSNVTVTENKVNGIVEVSFEDYAASDIRYIHSDVAVEKINESFSNESNLQNMEWQNIKKLSKPVLLSYNFESETIPIDETEIAFAPFATINKTENLFNQQDRTLPIEMPLLDNISKKLTISIPENYSVKSLPENLNLSYDGKVIAKVYYNISGNKIQILSKMRFKALTFKAEEYQNLKDIYTALINKESELISIVKN